MMRENITWLILFLIHFTGTAALCLSTCIFILFPFAAEKEIKYFYFDWVILFMTILNVQERYKCFFCLKYIHCLPILCSNYNDRERRDMRNTEYDQINKCMSCLRYAVEYLNCTSNWVLYIFLFQGLLTFVYFVSDKIVLLKTCLKPDLFSEMRIIVIRLA